MPYRGTEDPYSRSIIMSGDGGPVKQPLKFYSKEPTDVRDILLQTGKVKTVYIMDGEPEKVYVHFHDKVTAGNGRRSETMESKGQVCCLISALLFEHMEKRGIRTHFIDVPYLDTLLCKKLTIIPVEVIVRNITAGSIVSQTTLEEGKLIQPLIDGALLVNIHLQMLFNLMDIDLVDFKLEFGYDAHGNLLLADELSPDNMRLWAKGTRQRFDKDLFRKDEGDIVEAYKYILNKLRQFT